MRLVILGCLLSAFSSSQPVDPAFLDGMRYRQIGPFRGGRSVACSGVPGRPKDFYMGTCGGGLWKSENEGEDWRCVTDGFLGVGTVGAIAVSPSHPDVVYIGTGERDIRGNISHGDGVYKSSDAGKTWSHIGLRETQTVGKIVVHPKDPNTVWVAALGHIYGPNKERGVFKSTDGGKTWAQVLYESDKAGAVDICLDPKNPDTLYAATWEAWRTPYSLNSGGAGSKLWKSTDGGKTWVNLSNSPGLPQEVLGKIGVSVSPVDANRVYAIIEAQNGGVFKSDDAGENWTLVNESREFRQRAWYYTHILADPVEKDTVYVQNLSTSKSKDGGAKFTAISGSHSDCHDLWVDPSDNKRMIESNDGGASVKVDGKSWTAQDFPTGQFYHVSTDDSRPYRILGAQQDNSTVRILSRGGSRGIGPSDWEGTAGGESGYVVAKPGQPNIVFGGSYGGDLTMLDHSNNVARSVDPWPDNPMGHGAIDLKHRFQWTFPIVFSPHDPGVLYTCSQVVHKSMNGGESWQVISPDLTRNDPRTLQSSGGPITQDNTSVEYYGTVFTLSESPIAKGTLWAGSDDGLVHLTRDGGKAWINVTPRGAPERGLCSMIDASPHKPGRAFLALDNHENDDYAPYVYRTDDYGKSWVKVTSGLTSFVRVVREDPVRENMLYCGTEAGVSVSFDGGQNWQPLQFNLPVTPIHDLTVKDDDLVLATHGRGFWVYDNLESLRQLKQGLSPKSAFLFKPKTLLRGGGGGGGRGRGTPPPAGTQFGENPPMGLVVDLYLPNKVDKVEGSVKDGKGFQVASFSFSSPRAGFNRASASGFRYPGIRSFPGMVTWATRSGSLPAPPGDYFVEIQVGTEKLTQRFHYGRNPQTNSSEDDLKEQFALASKIVARTNEANDAVVIIRDIRKKAKDAAAAKPELKDAVDQLDQKLTPIEETIYQTKSKAGQDPLNYPIRLNDKLGGVLGVVLSGDWRPTKQSYEVFNLLSRELELPLTKLAACIKDDLAALNAKLEALGLKAIVPVQPNGEGGQGR